MSIIMEIPKSDLKLLAEAFHHVRSKNDPDYSVKKDPFKVASNYILMLKDIVFNMHAEEIIDKRLAKRLVFSPWISHWYNDVEEKKNLWLGFHISLKKAYNGISKIGTGIHFNNNDSNFKITGYVQDKSGEYLHETTYPDGDLIFEKYKYRLISFWKKWLK